MRRSVRSPVAPVLVALALVGCPGQENPDGGLDAAIDTGSAAPRNYVPEPFEPTPETIAYCQGHDDAAIEARITALLAQMTQREKTDLLAGDSIGGGTYVVDGVERLGIPGLHMLDGPRGLSTVSMRQGTAFPVAMMRGATWDPELEERVGHAMAIELRSAGADVLLAPTINILRHPRWGRAQETYSEDTDHMGELAVAFVRGVQAEGVMASAKHFAANSIEDNRHEVDVRIEERTLREVYLPHFERVVVEGHVASVMSAYNQVNGLYCDEQPLLLTTILREEWGFAGFVESDWILGTHGGVTSLRAGLDIEMPISVQFRGLLPALNRGELEEREVDAAVRRVLRAVMCFGLDSLPPRGHDERIDEPSQRETTEHLALAREVATRGIVLLRNEPVAATPLIPLEADALMTPGAVVLLGRNAEAESIGDAGSSAVEPSDVITAREGLEARLGASSVVSLAGDTLDAAASAAVTAASVVVIVTGLSTEDEGEGDFAGGDREELTLRATEIALIRAAVALNPRVVVVLEGGAAITSSDWDDEVPALLFAFYPGSQGGHAIADILLGDHPPTGRLPFSVPVAEADLPPFDNVSATVEYGYLHGYRHLAAGPTPAHYPFGFGLSTTTFAIASPTGLSTTYAEGDTIDVEVEVTNSGARAGTETVQLYVSALGSAVERAPLDLRAFDQVTLAPGATGTATLRVPLRDLAYWDAASGTWILEAVEYEVHIGTSAADLVHTSGFTVE
jgi:beta-glucosidase